MQQLSKDRFHHMGPLYLGFDFLLKQAQGLVLGVTLVTDAGGTWNLFVDI